MHTSRGYLTTNDQGSLATTTHTAIDFRHAEFLPAESSLHLRESKLLSAQASALTGILQSTIRSKDEFKYTKSIQLSHFPRLAQLDKILIFRSLTRFIK